MANGIVAGWFRKILSKKEDKFLSWEEYEKLIEEKDEEVIKNGEYYKSFCIFIFIDMFD